jgi:MFS family permease
MSLTEGQGTSPTSENTADLSDQVSSPLEGLLAEIRVGLGNDWKPPNFRWIQLATMFNVFLTGFDQTIAASTYAVIGSEFKSMNHVSWISTSYLLTSTAFQPLYGYTRSIRVDNSRTSDILGRKFCYLTSTSIFFIGCTLCGLSQNMLALNISRAFTGIGGAGLLTTSTVILSDHVPFHRRGIYQAINNLTMGTGAILGAALGGAIADNLGWRWAFYLQLPLASFGIAIGYLFLGDSSPSKSSNRLGDLDYLGSALLVVGLVIQLTGLNLGGNELAWSSPIVVGCLIISFVTLAAFMYVEGRVATHPVLPLSILKEAATMISSVFTAAACTSVNPMSCLVLDSVYASVVLPGSPFRVGDHSRITTRFSRRFVTDWESRSRHCHV